MSLVYDRRTELQIGTHALIVGISDYPHLFDAGGPFADLKLGLAPLTSAALSAWAFWEWLQTANLPVPLASSRLMLAPSQKEATRQPGFMDLHLRCDSDAFIDDISAWREDAASHEENVTFFMFVGHGLMRSRLDQMLLFADIGSGRGRAFQGAVELNSIVYGMVPDERRFPKMARKQFYFIDAPRVPIQEPLRATDVFDVHVPAIDDREIGIFHSALPGAMAYALPGGTTLFSAALLDGLRGEAAIRLPTTTMGASNEQRWGVTVNSLASYLTEEATQQSAKFNTQISYATSGTFRDTIVANVELPPPAELMVTVSPELSSSTISVKNSQGNVIVELLVAAGFPASIRLPSGLYIVEVLGNKQPTGTIVDVRPPRTMIAF